MLEVAPDTYQGKGMSTTYYNDKVDDIDLKITDKYIQYGSELLPASALSFVSVNKYNVRWWIPTLFLVIAAILFTYDKTSSYYGHGGTTIISMLLLIIGLVILLIDIIISRKRIIRIYSHSREHLYIEWKKGNYQHVVDALFKVIEGEEKPKTDNTQYMP